MEKRYVEEEDLLRDAFRLGAAVHASGFRPTFLVGLWRGGSSVAIAVQECLSRLGVEADHIALRTSYRGLGDYPSMVRDPAGRIRVHGTRYLLERLRAQDRLLLVDDVYSSGLSVDAVLRRLRAGARRNMPESVRAAAVWYRPQPGRTVRPPDYHVHLTRDWLVLPYELSGLSVEEIQEHKPYLRDILARLDAVRLAERG